MADAQDLKSCGEFHRIGSTPILGIVLYAAIAQLDRVPDYESGGCRFESCRVHVSKAKVDRLAYRLSGEIGMGSWH